MSKILYAASTMSHINNFHRDYINALRAQGHTVLIMAKGEGADFDIPFEKKMLSLKNLSCTREIRKILDAENFDCAVLNTALAAFFIRLAVRGKRRMRILNIVHGYLFGKNTGFIKKTILLTCERILRGRTDRIIVMNDEDMEIARKHKLAREGVEMSLGMGAAVHGEQTSPESLRSDFSESGEFVLLFVGELSGRKNQKMLISAMPRLKRSIPGARLWLVGDGGEEESLKEQALALGVDSCVDFLGRRDNPCDFIRACDLYVTASRIEGMPFNIIEAMGCGKTVVATDVKGNRDIVDVGVTGYLYREDDVEGFVRVVSAIYSGTLSVNANEIYSRYKIYSKDNVFDKTYSKIKEALNI